MGLLIKKQLENNTIMGIWEITEGYNELQKLICLHPEEQEKLNSFGNHDRKLEWLSVRSLLNELSDTSLRITYNGDNKPFVHDYSYKISISHSYKFTSILLNKYHKVGIDLEHMSHRISKIAHKFINENEYITDDEKLKKYHLYIHWCAKEALYKICDKKDINFKDNLAIEPFFPTDKGSIQGWVNNKYGNEKFLLHYFSLNNYIVVWCSK